MFIGIIYIETRGPPLRQVFKYEFPILPVIIEQGCGNATLSEQVTQRG